MQRTEFCISVTIRTAAVPTSSLELTSESDGLFPDKFGGNRKRSLRRFSGTVVVLSQLAATSEMASGMGFGFTNSSGISDIVFGIRPPKRSLKIFSLIFN